MQEKKFYIRYPLRQSRMKSGYMQLFYALLGFVWLGAAFYLYLYNPSNNILLPIIYIVIGAGIEVLAYFYPKLFLGKYVQLSDAGIVALLPSTKKISIKWDDISSIQNGSKIIDIKTSQDDIISLKLTNMYDVEWENLKKALNTVIQEKELM